MIKELHNKLVNKKITAVELAESYFARIKEKDGEIGAYLTLTEDLALEQARKVDEKIFRGEKIGIMEGIPIAIKDNLCIMGVRTTAGSKILDNYIAPYDATVIKKLKEAGAVILGKTNMDEFAMGSSTETSIYQKTRNPLDLERVPGGSSGGSAASIASEEAVCALGTDTGGSIRQPASFCGVVGLKPTYGRVSRYGAIAMASSLDQIGPFGMTVEDTAIVLSVISGQDKMDATCAQSPTKDYTNYLTGDIKGIKIGIVKEYFEGLNGNIKKIVDDTIEKYKKLGAEIKEISLPHSQYSLAIYYMIMPCEVSSNLARFDGIKYGLRINDKQSDSNESGDFPQTLLETYLDSRKYGFGDEVKRRIMLGTYALSAGYYDAYYKKAQKVRALIKQDFEKVFEEIDFIFSPTAPEMAFKFGEKTDDPMKMYLSDIYTITANLVGIPAISFPIGMISEKGDSSKKLPIGGQLMGKWFDEEGLLNAAYTFEINK
ncbi:MAG: Glutamyl-tRNA(Gln) amidotransferase subunit A [Candidatus Moranbacteria bacterium GW2011_GWE2_35_2-]|nr:MAG: Glutamyl-tRNA(Gln) amidotransferase subunit A [Candidatus Moranbacteria bacterium GW2011_GWE2_35_2-]KKQ22520.1 MAG: Glutamyl-tRNA(Gln) amidotransferase subunit A [Candidatus Moranbacteria bacterium GW2011_GWF2_37_11]KKQ29589.1 MAG: Glutamyl-tRNA(Gln) amidotransferase subunit A [Candidatus Moranbacteria bacterium GW2011_GWD1_37_17]KKQ30540.1 MAG: Glutamyl-tRNA(Gln) amidotransferase subunit A [Candidatus Moranbacteria bacterium GW2011_GWE1_37_24]HBO17214.1 Asp-tRNA(Asn)/Glu-tRNA(Gln) amid